MHELARENELFRIRSRLFRVYEEIRRWPSYPDSDNATIDEAEMAELLEIATKQAAAQYADVWSDKDGRF